MVVHTSRLYRRMSESAQKAYDFLNSKQFEEGVKVGNRWIKGASQLTEMMDSSYTANKSPRNRRIYEATSDVLRAYKDNFPEKWESSYDDTEGVSGLGTMLSHADRLSSMVDNYNKSRSPTISRTEPQTAPTPKPVSRTPSTVRPWQSGSLMQEALD